MKQSDEMASIGPVKLEAVPQDDPCAVEITGSEAAGASWVAWIDTDGDGEPDTPGPTLYWGQDYVPRGDAIVATDGTVVGRRGAIVTLYGRYVRAQVARPDCPDLAFRVVRLTPRGDERAGRITGDQASTTRARTSLDP